MISNLIEEIREYGTLNDVPIMSVESIDTIKKIIIDNNFSKSQADYFTWVLLYCFFGVEH